MTSDTPTLLHCGLVAVVGRANVGKSTLVNHLLGEKVSVVGPVAQTTRNVVRGILNDPRGQAVFLDTPGVHQAEHDLGRLMNRMARTAVEGVDVVLLVLDVSRVPAEEDEGWMRRLCRDEFRDAILLFACNKIDAGGRHMDEYVKTWSGIAVEKRSARNPEWIRVSARTGQGAKELLDRLFELLPAGPALFPDNILTDYPRKLTIGDIIREKLIVRLRDEVPHHIAVWVEHIREKENGWDVEAFIYVNRHSQKGMVIGEKGRLLRAVRREAEKELSEIYEHPVRLDLWVKVEKDWIKNFWILKKLGYA